MAIGSRRDPETELREFARVNVRAGFLGAAELQSELAAAVESEMPGLGSDVLARVWLAAARQELDREQAGWPEHTDYDALQAAFAECTEHGVPVLQGVEDHWVATRALQERRVPRGIIWFTPSDVWHAIDFGMLEVNVWHPDTANAAEGDSLLVPVLSCLSRHGLDAKFDEGRVEIACKWLRRI